MNGKEALMTMETQTYTFKVNLDLACSCMGCCMDESVYADVELAGEEAQQLREWVGAHAEAEFEDLKEDLPEIYGKIRDEATSAIFWWAVEDGIAQGGYEDYGYEMFEQEVADGTFVIDGYDPETDGDLDEAEDIDVDGEFDRWCEEKDALDGEARVDYLEARYNITEGTDISCLDYSVELEGVV